MMEKHSPEYFIFKRQQVSPFSLRTNGKKWSRGLHFPRSLVMARANSLLRVAAWAVGGGGVIVCVAAHHRPTSVAMFDDWKPVVMNRMASTCAETWHGANLDPSTIVENTRIQKDAYAYIGSFTGLVVMAAPRGTGKTTAVAAAIRKLRIEEPHVTGQIVFDLEGASSLRAALDEKFGGHAPEDVIPRGTVIVLDHLDDIANESVSDMAPTLRKLAHTAVQTRHFTVVALCRDPVFAEAVVQLNGGEKMHRVEGVNEWRLTPDEVDAVCDKAFQAKSLHADWFRTEWKDAIRTAAHEARTPSFVVKVTRRVGPRHPPVNLDMQVAEEHETWNSFLSSIDPMWLIHSSTLQS